MKKLMFSALVATSVILLSACSPDNDNKIKVAINTGPDEAIWQEVQKVAKNQYQLNVEVVSFNDYVLPNEALRNKDVDANAFQSLPYLEDQSEERGYKFAILGKTFIFPIAAYSHKIKKLGELQDGATLTLSNEATTLGRSLLLLQAQGLIKLKDGVGYLPTALDIVENPKKLKFVQVDTPQLTRTLDDPNVSLSIINTNFSAQAGLPAARDGLFMEGVASPYVNALVVRAEDKDSEKLQKLKAAFQSKDVADKALEVYKGDAIKAW
ncbi:MetQ/NlpA family ABC transporter substrate-binding protein [Serratia entomophila]|uniref:MetQ/NlpA family ABC transporter substrate-binding protein n=1 Tax=Serratia entomophila TaxID=42906 RepID=UPI002177F19E|nr:MetQ/NlpA family ABC transporter substrate-binding protein [Serratia entomophila]CAI0767145.1 D-methionine-binding lipoprotein metQ precursor [Serratia entomophila]CAI1501757.1 D-methionine-binding lipoprotein metQ precursor [Serratia entomophila]CAI1506524.1 D-methionine-binding lipoprotein metQ precursor [Serratia entomophila]CAI1512287.1 D-methionine-binding lipoprotein metQ precursor [Serratia entomophila]CAI1618944.1 D-methionine-binding lipoprotein metQ precursor [Serratia entomophila